jgi:uncharacterized membrane protein
MILNSYSEHMGGSNMMDWGQNMWIYMILGFLIFLIFVLILLYYLYRRIHPSEEKFNNITLPEQKGTNTIARKENYCPKCGEKIDDILPKICPYCGSKLN